VRLTRPLVPGLLLLAVLLFARAARTQDSQIMMPAQSAAKAKQLLQETIQALGGDAYLNVRDVTINGRLGQFGHSGDLTGYMQFWDYNKLPDKDFTEYGSKHNIIEAYNGDHGWTMDRGGVTDIAEASLEQRKEDLKTDIDMILRYRIKEPGMSFRYAGPDVVELKQADWVELADSEGRTIRIALAQSTHLPIQERVETRDPTYHTRSVQITYFSNYHPIQGVQSPFQIAREKNGMKIFQAFFDDFKYNTGLNDSLFTRQELENRYAKMKDKYKGDKNKKKEKD
jgi:hypothetical protein